MIVAPENACLPVSASNRTQPNDQMSARLSGCCAAGLLQGSDRMQSP